MRTSSIRRRTTARAPIDSPVNRSKKENVIDEHNYVSDIKPIERVDRARFRDREDEYRDQENLRLEDVGLRKSGALEGYLREVENEKNQLHNTIQQLTTKQQDIQKQINHLKDDIAKQDQVIRELERHLDAADSQKGQIEQRINREITTQGARNEKLQEEIAAISKEQLRIKEIVLEREEEVKLAERRMQEVQEELMDKKRLIQELEQEIQSILQAQYNELQTCKRIEMEHEDLIARKRVYLLERENLKIATEELERESEEIKQRTEAECIKIDEQTKRMSLSYQRNRKIITSKFMGAIIRLGLNRSLGIGLSAIKTHSHLLEIQAAGLNNLVNSLEQMHYKRFHEAFRFLRNQTLKWDKVNLINEILTDDLYNRKQSRKMFVNWRNEFNLRNIGYFQKEEVDIHLPA